MSNERALTEQEARENLEFIRRVMEETRRATVESNPVFFLWGVVIWVEVLLTYGLIYLKIGLQGSDLTSYIPWVWYILSTAVIAYTIASIVRQRRARPPLSSFSDRVIGYVWMSCLAGATLIGYVSMIAAYVQGYEVNYATSMATYTVLLACALLVTGGVYQLRVLKYLALAFWIGAALLLLVPFIWVSLVFGLIVGTGFLITGAVLRRQAQVQHVK